LSGKPPHDFPISNYPRKPGNFNLSYPAAIVEKLVELAGAAGFKDRIIKVSKAMRLYREYFDAGS
jgi:hypothetical protein